MQRLGVILILVSFLPWLMTFAVPWLPFTIAQKSLLVPGLFVMGEFLFWGGVAIVGKEVAERYRRWLNPRFIGQRLRVWRRLRRNQRRRSSRL